MSNQFIRSGLIVSMGMLGGRAFGFLREIVLLNVFGVSEQADIAILLLTLPDLLVALLVGGAANAVLVPRFQEIDGEKRYSYFWFLNKKSLVFFVAIALLLILAADLLLLALAPGFSADTRSGLSDVFRIVLISVPVVALTTVSRAFLQSSQRFLTTSLENLIYNMVLIGIIYFFTKD